MTCLLERIMLEGKPFHVSLTTGVGVTTDVTFDLDTDDIDIDADGTPETTPFLGMMLFITGIDIQSAAGNILDYLKVDENVIVDGKILTMTTGQRWQANGEQITLGSSGNSPKVKDIFGHEYIPCRKDISLKASATTGGATTALIRGLYIANKF